MHFLCVPQGKYNFRVERRKGKKRGRRKKQRGKMGGGRKRDGNICRCKFENLKKKGSKRQNKRIGRHEYLAPHPAKHQKQVTEKLGVAGIGGNIEEGNLKYKFNLHAT